MQGACSGRCTLVVSRRRIVSAFVVYGALAAIAVVWLLARDDAAAPWMSASRTARLGLSLGLGVALAVSVIASTRWLVRRTGWARDLHVRFRGVLGPVSGFEIAVFAISSGVAEELFFRAALQPTVGYVTASVLFGLVHFGGRRLLPWTLWAAAMGFALGAVYALTGELVGCVVAHVWINYENLHFIAGHEPAGAAPGPVPRAPTLIGSRRRAGGTPE